MTYYHQGAEMLAKGYSTPDIPAETFPSFRSCVHKIENGWIVELPGRDAPTYCTTITEAADMVRDILIAKGIAS